MVLWSLDKEVSNLFKLIGNYSERDLSTGTENVGNWSIVFQRN